MSKAHIRFGSRHRPEPNERCLQFQVRYSDERNTLISEPNLPMESLCIWC